MRRLLILLVLLLTATTALAETELCYTQGDQVEDFVLTTWDGQEISLYAELAEKDVVVLHFFSTVCAACEEEIPLWQTAWETYADRVGFIAVDIVDDEDARLGKFLQRRGVTYPVAVDRAGLTLEYPIYGVPLTMIIDKDGVLQEILGGALTDLAELEEILAPYLVSDEMGSEPELTTQK